VEIGASDPGANTEEQPGQTRRLAPPWKPGQSGNPSGRPKVGRTVSAAYAELLDTPGNTLKAQLENFRDKRGAAFCASDMVAVGMLTSAVNPSNRGQTSAASEITDRTEGKVPSTTALIGADGGPLRIEWVNDWRTLGGGEG
jgi:hypothetical protein